MNDVVSFDDWYRSEHRRVLAAVSAVCVGDHARAEDATNEAFLKALERWDTVRVMDNPRAWVATVAVNNVKQSFFRRKRRLELLNTQRLTESTIDVVRDLDLWNAFTQLTFRQRKAIVLRYLEDLPQQAVADELGIAVGTAAATLNQARSKLRAEIQQGDT